MISAENLKKLKIFSQMSVETLSKLSGVMEEKKFSKDQTILKEGETTGSLFIVADGAVSIQKKIDQKGSEIKSVAKIEEGEIFGEMAFLENQPHSASVVSLNDALIYSISRKSLDSLFKKDAKLASEQVFALFSAVSSRLRSTTNELVTIFEIGRAVTQATSENELMERILNRLEAELGESTTMGFYRWNLFNDEFDLKNCRGPNKDKLPKEVERSYAPTLFGDNGIVSPVTSNESVEGLLIYQREKGMLFDSGLRQMIETVSSVLAPALLGVRKREEEVSRERLMQGKSMGESF